MPYLLARLRAPYLRGPAVLSSWLCLLMLLSVPVLLVLSVAWAQSDPSALPPPTESVAAVDSGRTPNPSEAEAPAEGTFIHGIAFGVAVAGEFGDRFPLRWQVSSDLPAVPLRARLAVDIARQSPLSQATLSVAGGLLLRVPSDAVDGYAGLTLGAQFDAGAWPEANDGFFTGALVGVERRIGARLTVFVEAELDLYFAAPPATGTARQYDRLYPTIAVGVTVRPFAPAARAVAKNEVNARSAGSSLPASLE